MLSAIINEARTIDFNEIVRRVLSRHTDELIALQKARLHKGQASDGGTLSLPYSKGHAKKRTKAGRPTSVKDLDFTGEHFEQMYARVQKEFTLMGSDSNENILEWQNGKHVYGITSEDIDYILWELGWAYEISEEYRRALLN